MFLGPGSQGLENRESVNSVSPHDGYVKWTRLLLLMSMSVVYTQRKLNVSWILKSWMSNSYMSIRNCKFTYVRMDVHLLIASSF